MSIHSTLFSKIILHQIIDNSLASDKPNLPLNLILVLFPYHKSLTIYLLATTQLAVQLRGCCHFSNTDFVSVSLFFSYLLYRPQIYSNDISKCGQSPQLKHHSHEGYVPGLSPQASVSRKTGNNEGLKEQPKSKKG